LKNQEEMFALKINLFSSKNIIKIYTNRVVTLKYQNFLNKKKQKSTKYKKSKSNMIYFSCYFREKNHLYSTPIEKKNSLIQISFFWLNCGLMTTSLFFNEFLSLFS